MAAINPHFDPLQPVVFAAPPSDCTVLTIGNDRAARAVIQLAKERFPELVPVIRHYDRSKDNKGAHFFLRDYAVFRPADGVLVAPYAIEHANLDEIFRTLALHPRIDISNKATYALGFDPAIQMRLVEDSNAEEFPIILGRTCVEGGNIFLFKGADGITRGIIGDHSLILSFIALTEQGYFEEKAALLQIVRDTIGEIPSDDFVRLARYIRLISCENPNFSSPDKFFASLSHHLFFDSPLDERETLYPLKPLTGKQRTRYRKVALELQARFKLTLIELATERGVLVENLAVYKQTRFHIDLELTVDTRKGIVYVQGNRQTIRALNDALPEDPEPALPRNSPRCVLLSQDPEEEASDEASPSSELSDEEEASPSPIFVEQEADSAFLETPPPPELFRSAALSHKERWESNIVLLRTTYKVMSISYDLLLKNDLEPGMILKRRSDLIQFEARHAKSLRLLRYCDFVLQMGSPYEEENRDAIERATGMKVVFVPGSYEVFEDVEDGSRKPTRMNFLNGIFLHGQNESAFVTNGGDPRLEAAFEEAVHEADPDLHIEFIPGMDKMLTRQEGGLHCLTRETLS